MIVTRKELLGPDWDKFYHNENIHVVKSGWDDQKYEEYDAKMSRRENEKKDPTVTMGNIDDRNAFYLYLGNRAGEHTDFVKNNHGAYVYIKSKYLSLSFPNHRFVKVSVIVIIFSTAYVKFYVLHMGSILICYP